MTSLKSTKWKPVNISLENAAELVSFEELNDYEIIRGEELGLNRSEDDDSHSRGKRKRKKKTKNHPSDVKNKKRKLPTDAANSAPDEENAVSMGEDEMFSVTCLPCDTEVKTELENTWHHLNLPESILKALAKKNFQQPTEIQKITLPEAILKRKDVLGAAETGSGKTLAFAIPIVASILEAQKNGIDTAGSLWALIITPARELAIQVKNHVKDICSFTNIKVEVIVGGLSVDKQDRRLNEKPQIIVATPGRLWEMIRREHEHLKDVHKIRFLVIDEADRMFEKNHFEDFPRLLERINTSSKHVICRQTLVFSATLTLTHEPPLYVLKKKRGKTNKSIKISPDEKLKEFINLLKLKNPSVLDITRKNVLADGISESCILCSLDEKDYFLYYILKVHPGKKIIFANSVTCVKRLHRLLSILECNPKLLFADMAQNQRLKNLDNFAKNPDALLLATDVAARGLDIANIECIIHYQIPKTSEVYVHRSGRSVRGTSATGSSIALCSPGENYYYSKIRNSLTKDKKYPLYTVMRPEVFAVAKKAVDISRRIEQAETKMRNVQMNSSWIEKCAREMDILLDDDEKPEKLNDQTRKHYLREIKKLKMELKSLLRRPVLPLQESLKYPNFNTVQSYWRQCADSKK